MSTPNRSAYSSPSNNNNNNSTSRESLVPASPTPLSQHNHHHHLHPQDHPLAHQDPHSNQHYNLIPVPSMSHSSIPHPQASHQTGSSQSMEQAPLQHALLPQSYAYNSYNSHSARVNGATSAGTPTHSSTAAPQSASPTGFVSPGQAPGMHTLLSAPTASPPHAAYGYAPYVPPQTHDPSIYTQPPWAGAVQNQQHQAALYATQQHQNAMLAQPPQNRPPPNVYSFVPIQGPQQHKRPRRRFEEIDRIYKCGWQGCEKAYGTLNHLNAHVTMQTHGPKRTSDEFKEIRAAWKQRNKENEARKREDLSLKAQATPTASSMQSASMYYSPHSHVPYQSGPVGYPMVSPMNPGSGSFPVSPYTSTAPVSGSPSASMQDQNRPQGPPKARQDV